MTDTSIKKSDLARKDADFRELICGRLARKRMSQADLGQRVGCSQSRISIRISRPEMMTIRDLRKWATVLDLTAEDIVKLI